MHIAIISCMMMSTIMCMQLLHVYLSGTCTAGAWGKEHNSAFVRGLGAQLSCTAVTMLIRLSSYATWSTSELVVCPAAI